MSDVKDFRAGPTACALVIKRNAADTHEHRDQFEVQVRHEC